MKHILSIVVENRPGVLSRISGLFTRRGFNIDSLAVGPTENENVSRITIVVHGNDEILEQITKQLNKLIDVIKILDLTSQNHVDRELVMMRLNVPPNKRPELMQLVEIFRARVVDFSDKSLIVEITGSGDKVEAFKSLVAKFGIKELVRTGKIALARGPK